MEMPDLPDTPTGAPNAPTGTNNQPWDCTTTGVEMVEKQSRLPNTENRQYLHIKVEYAMRFPQLSAQIRREGKTYRMSLKQTMMSGLIRHVITAGITRRRWRLICEPRRPALF